MTIILFQEKDEKYDNFECFFIFQCNEIYLGSKFLTGFQEQCPSSTIIGCACYNGMIQMTITYEYISRIFNKYTLSEYKDYVLRNFLIKEDEHNISENVLNKKHLFEVVKTRFFGPGSKQYYELLCGNLRQSFGHAIRNKSANKANDHSMHLKAFSPRDARSLITNTSHYIIHEMKTRRNHYNFSTQINILTIKNTVTNEILTPSQLLAGITIRGVLCVGFKKRR